MDFAREGERKKVKAVLGLKGVKKPCVINKTNALNLSEEFGTDFDDWVDKRITVKAERTQFDGGKPVMGLRLYPANAESRRPPTVRRAIVLRRRVPPAARLSTAWPRLCAFARPSV
jgi:hypothetical protein